MTSRPRHIRKTVECGYRKCCAIVYTLVFVPASFIQNVEKKIENRCEPEPPDSDRRPADGSCSGDLHAAAGARRRRRGSAEGAGDGAGDRGRGDHLQRVPEDEG